MNKLFLLLLAALPVVLSAQDKVINDPDAQARTVSAFHAIKVSTGIQLILKQGSDDAVAVSASDKEARDRIKTEVVNGVLKIYYEYNEHWWNGFNTGNKHLKAYVSFKNIDRLSGSSGSHIIVDGSITAGGLGIDLSSGAHFNGNIRAAGLSVGQSSGSHMTVSGQVQTLAVQTSSGAHFIGFDIAAGKCNAGASSGGRIEVTVNSELDAQASSGGHVEYKGNGVIRKMSTSSGGHISKNG